MKSRLNRFEGATSLTQGQTTLQRLVVAYFRVSGSCLQALAGENPPFPVQFLVHLERWHHFRPGSALPWLPPNLLARTRCPT